MGGSEIQRWLSGKAEPAFGRAADGSSVLGGHRGPMAGASCLGL